MELVDTLSMKKVKTCLNRRWDRKPLAVVEATKVPERRKLKHLNGSIKLTSKHFEAFNS